MAYETATQKQKGFARDTFSGMTNRDAYMNNYNAEGMALTTIDAAASRCANNVKVKAYLDELNKETETENVASVLERKETLTKIIRKEHTDRYKIPIYTPKLQAIDLLSKLDGAYAPDRHELTGRDGSPLEIDTKELLIARIETIINRREDSDNPLERGIIEVKEVDNATK